MTERVPGVGHLTDIPRAVEDPSFEGLQLAPEDWFVLSRVDGETSIRDLFALSPTGRDETVEILRRLAEHRLIELPDRASASGSTSAPDSSADEAATTARSMELPEPPAGWPTAWESFALPASLASAPAPLDEEMRRLLAYFHAHLREVSFYQLLGVDPDTSSGKIKRAYFQLSKVFHPDRFFRQDLGAFGPMLTEVFRWLNEAQKTLGNRQRRADYDALLARGYLGPWQLDEDAAPPPPASTVATQAAPRRVTRPLTELLGEAKRLERGGDFAGAVDCYEAALAQRESAELMNRVAECLIRLKTNLDHAEARARGAIALAPTTARYHVALAFIFEQQGRLDDAVASYRKALEIDPDHRGAQTRLSRLGHA